MNRRLLILLICALFLRHPNGLFAQCITVTPTSPYRETFETSDGNWASGGTLNDWAWGTPAKSVITAAGEGLKCWITGGLNSNAYNDNERSYLVSRCFNLSAVVHPVIRFKIFWETEYRFDGASFQYSVDNGTTWLNVGAVNEPANCLNANWFNFSNISNMTGLGPNREGWCGTIRPAAGSCGGGNGSAGWVQASHSLKNLGGVANVQFRFTFGAGSLCNDFDGFAVDDIEIAEAPPDSVRFSSSCGGRRTLAFINGSTSCLTSFAWDFGDPASGALNTANTVNATHVFSAPGKYTVTLTGSGGNGPALTVSNTVYVMDVKTTIVQPIKCGNDSTGILTAAASTDAAVTPIAFQWNTIPVVNGNTLSNVPAGTYVVTASAANVCAARDTVRLLNPPPLQISNVTTTPVKCSSPLSGSASMSVAGGTAPYSILWNSTAGTASGNPAVNLAAGTYTPVVTDNNGCFLQAAPVTIVQAVKPSLAITPANTFCAKDNGSAVGNVSGGTPPYRYLWTPTGLSTSTINNLPPGTYTLLVTDAADCKAVDSVVVQPSVGVRIAGISTSPARCNGEASGAASASVIGGTPPITYAWTNGSQQINSTSLQQVLAGDYLLTVKDNDGCIDTATALILQPPPFLIDVQTTSTTCGLSNGKAWAVVSGGTSPFQFDWSNGSRTDTARNLGGYVSVKVTDAIGCSRQSDRSLVIPSRPLQISLGNDTAICPGNMVLLNPGKFAAYLWQDNSIDSIYKAIKSGQYKVQVTDTNGCKATAAVNVLAECRDIVFPDAFTPNGDGKNDLFGPIGTVSAVSDYLLRVYNRWGQLVFTSSNPRQKWNGIQGTAAGTVQSFVWMASYSFDKQPLQYKKGTILLIR